MKRGSTNFLKIAVIFLGIPILALCIFVLPTLAKDAAESNSEFAYVVYGIVIVMYVSAIPYFVALYQAFKLLSYIDKNKAFSEISVKALKNIKHCAITISGLYVVGTAILLYLCGVRRRPRCRIGWNAFYFCSNGYRSLCRCSPKTFTRSDYI